MIKFEDGSKWRIGDPRPRTEAVIARPLRIEASGREAEAITKLITSLSVSVRERRLTANKE